MKNVSILLFAFSLFAGVQLVSAKHHEEGEHAHTPLEEEMEHIGDAWKLVRRAIRDPEQFSAAAEQVEIMLKHAKKSLELEPSLLAQQEGEAAKKAFLEGYQKGMKQTIALLEELHAALEAGDAVATQAAVGKINDARKKGHQEYKPQDED